MQEKIGVDLTVMEKGHPHGDAHKVILCYNYFP
jgi:hypothetical protein